jgi:hypothetical protein
MSFLAGVLIGCLGTLCVLFSLGIGLYLSLPKTSPDGRVAGL